MKNLKPLILGCIAGCGVMFVALQYHVVHSHDGLQLIPRAPRATLGLAWVDIRDWDAETWSDRPALARALIAHGSSDLISASVVSDIGDSLDSDSGTIGELRSLLNESLTSDFDAPLFASDDAPFESEEDDPVKPFPQETVPPDWDDSFFDVSEHDTAWPAMGSGPGRRLNGARRDFSSGFAGFDDFEPLGTANHPAGDYRSARGRFSGFKDYPENDPFSDMHSSWPSESHSGSSSYRTNAAQRLRETRILEDLLFSEEDESGSVATDGESGFESLTRTLESRASRALNHAGSDFYSGTSDMHGIGGTDRDRFRDLNRPETLSRGGRRVTAPQEVPHSIRSRRDGFDPFLN